MAQVIISLLDGNLICEAPGKNGVREKITLSDSTRALPPEIMASLFDQRDRERAWKARSDERELAEAIKRHKRIQDREIQKHDQEYNRIVRELEESRVNLKIFRTNKTIAPNVGSL